MFEEVYRKNPKKMYSDAVQIQDACNLIAVSNTFIDMLKATDRNVNNMAVVAVFFKMYDMMHGPDTKGMYEALKHCEQKVKEL